MPLYGAPLAAGVVQLTDSSGGTPVDTIANGALTDGGGGTASGATVDAGATYNQTTTNNNNADMVAKINTLNDSVSSLTAKINEMLAGR